MASTLTQWVRRTQTGWMMFRPPPQWVVGTGVAVGVEGEVASIVLIIAVVFIALVIGPALARFPIYNKTKAGGVSRCRHALPLLSELRGCPGCGCGGRPFDTRRKFD